MGEPLTTFSRKATRDAQEAVGELGFAASLLGAVLVEAGGTIDLGYQSMGEGALHDIEVVKRADNLGVTVRIAVTPPGRSTDV